MGKGILAEKDVERDILRLASDGEEYQASYFVKNIKAAKNTVLKYLRKLVDNHLIDVKLSEGTFKPVFKINDKGLNKVQREALKNQLSKYMDEMTDDEVRTQINLLKNMGHRIELGPRIAGYVKDKDGKVKGPIISLVGGTIEMKNEKKDKS